MDSIWETGYRHCRFLWREGDIINLEEAMQMEQLRDNENSFYDVFDKISEKELIHYKQMAGMPIISINIEDVKKSLNK